MCDRHCDTLETLDPAQEFQKFLQGKPIIQPAKLYEGLCKPEDVTKNKVDLKLYGIEKNKEKNVMFHTSNSEYGHYPPCKFTAPFSYRPRPQRFSNDRIRFPMFCNFSLNTMRNEEKIN